MLEICDNNNITNKNFYLNRETFYIKSGLQLYGEKVLNNLTIAGSSLGYKHTIEDRLMSELKIEKKRNMFNKKHTEKTLRSISTSMKAKPGRVQTEIKATKIRKAKKGKKTR